MDRICWCWSHVEKDVDVRRYHTMVVGEICCLFGNGNIEVARIVFVNLLRIIHITLTSITIMA